MANVFKNAANVPSATANTLIYVTPLATNSVVHAAFVTNMSKDTATYANVTVEDLSASNAIRGLGQYIPIQVGGQYILDKPINLEAGDKIFVRGANLEVFLSVLEVS